MPTPRNRPEPPHPPEGLSAPLGASLVDGGCNFSLFSRSATAVELLLFDRVEDAKPSRVVALEPARNRTYHYWHTFLAGVRAGQLYGWRVHGPDEPGRGLRFDPAKLLLDPYGLGVAVPRGYSRAAASQPGDNAASAMKSVVADLGLYDWEGDVPLRHPSSRTVIYEMHVRGFTRHPSSGVAEARRGTFAGLMERIPYLQSLGITAVELLPVFQFCPADAPEGRVNYWGYSPVSFFAPHQAYSSAGGGLAALDEFRDMVKALHRAGIEVILDVVYNHTAEGNERGPFLGLRGIDNPTYYTLEADRARYANFSGTGNTLNANNPIVRRMIVDSLRHWARDMHVDGFRFDLASILARDAVGHPLPNPPVLWDIESEPDLAGTKLIAEAWDAAGLVQVGRFVGDAWKEWNGHFRDDARSYLRGEPGSMKRFVDRLVGSPQVYAHKEREAEQSVNFVTCHDGFTLNDLVSYSGKHNLENGESNRDGADDNRSWNCGAEGPTDDPEVESLRSRQVRNFLAVTLLSLGVPMILMGDECRRTQRGNNNAYCHDEPWNWFDWTLPERHADLRRFVSLLVARRVQRVTGPESRRATLVELLHEGRFAWHGPHGGHPDWSDHSLCVGVSVEIREERLRFCVLLNAWREAVEFALPALEVPDAQGCVSMSPADAAGAAWRRWIDTALPSPGDIVPWEDAVPLHSARYRLEAHSVVALVAPSTCP